MTCNPRYACPGGPGEDPTRQAFTSRGGGAEETRAHFIQSGAGTE